MERWLVGLLLMGQVLLAPWVAFVLTAGHSFPVPERAGVMTRSGEVTIVQAVCPGERLEVIEVRREEHEREAGGPRPPPVWRVAGDAPLPEKVVIGEDVPGLRTEQPLEGSLSPTVLHSLMVGTDEIFSYFLFTPEEVSGTGIEFGGRIFADEGEFREAAYELAPCGDPYGDEVRRRIVLVLLIAQGAAFLLGLGMVLTPVVRAMTRAIGRRRGG